VLAPQQQAASPAAAGTGRGGRAGRGGAPARPAARLERLEDRQPVAAADEGIASRSLDELNRDSPLRPAFFLLDSSDLDDTGRSVVTSNVEVLKKYPQWVITIEGHCDERGTAEYNLALGERRAAAVKTYMVSLGIAESRTAHGELW
jgi:peptidoglycan-associated lipoprotein